MTPVHRPARPGCARTRRPTTPLATAVALLAALALLAGCAGGDEPDSAGSPAPSGPTAAGRPAPAPPPETGSCHRLDFESAAMPTDDSRPVPCRDRHTSVTIGVGTVRQLHDGHLLAIDSHSVQRQLARRCPARMAHYLGGDRTAVRLSRFQAVWFHPSVAQADLGADWSRCDVVAVATDGRLAVLPTRLKGILDRRRALDRFGTCGTAAPDSSHFRRVICSERHSWRAIDVVELPGDTTYLDPTAGRAAGEHCKERAAARAGSALKFTWSFEWPNKERWKAGQRYGYCWVPVR